MQIEPKPAQIQSALFELFIKVVAILEREKIDYWLDFGTLLGAVRHKDFIPWDDDIDLAIPYESVNRVIDLIASDLSNLVTLAVPEEGNPVTVTCRIGLKGVFGVEKNLDSMGVSREYSPNVALDIFAMEFHSASFSMKKMRLWRAFLSKIWQVKRLAPFVSEEFVKAKYSSLGTWVVFMIALVPDKFLAFFTSPNCDKKVNSKKISHVIESSFANITVDSNTVYPLRHIDFRGLTCLAPNDAERYLSSIYGRDFMTIPSKSNRITHFDKILIERESPWREFFVSN